MERKTQDLMVTGQGLVQSPPPLSDFLSPHLPPPTTLSHFSSV